MTNAIHTGLLRDIVKDRAAAGEHWIPVPALLRRLQLDERLEEIRSRLGDAQTALREGDCEQVKLELEFAESILRRTLDG
jgi:hypothetical protein